MVFENTLQRRTAKCNAAGTLTELSLVEWNRIWLSCWRLDLAYLFSIECLYTSASLSEFSRVHSSRAQSGRVESSQVESSQVESSQVESSQVEFSQVESSQAEPSLVQLSGLQSSLVESRMVEMGTLKLRICFYCTKDSDSIRLDRNIFDSCVRSLRKME